MKKSSNIIKLNFENSSIMMVLAEYSTGVIQVEINQTLSKNGKSQQLILTPPTIKRSIEALEEYQKLIYTLIPKKGKLFQNHIKIEERYLRGVSIPDLAMQFEKPEEAIKNLLISRGIQIVNLNPPRKPHRWWKKR